jgi:hypothetical protein
MTVYVVGLSGKAGSGKDTLASYMISELMYECGDTTFVTKLAIADNVKKLSTQYFGDICDVVLKDPVSRYVLQGVGQMMREEISEDYWIKKAKYTIDQLVYGSGKENSVIFITDVRYLNEVSAILEDKIYSGDQEYVPILIRIDGRTRLEGNAAEHPSETNLDDYSNFKYTYNNTGTLDDLYNFGDTIIKGDFHGI